MTTKTKGRAGGHQATPNATSDTSNFSAMKRPVKAIVMTLALWGLVPVSMVNWILDKGGLRDD